jgi:hypothetical protein
LPKQGEQEGTSHRNLSKEIERSGHDNNEEESMKQKSVGAIHRVNTSSVNQSAVPQNNELKDQSSVLNGTEEVSEKAKPKAKWKVQINKVLDHYITALFMTLITVYSLFFDDIRALAFPPSADNVFYGITTACMAFFLLEIILACIVKDDYFLSFFFWLDVISTLSMIPDIGWIWNAITGTGKGV